jgi:hypothetical protein
MSITLEKSTYFYNIELSDENIVSNYNIWFKNRDEQSEIEEIYENYFMEYMQKNNVEEPLDYIGYESIDNTTIYSLRTDKIISKVYIKTLESDEDFINVKIELINLLPIVSSQNLEYTEMLDNLQHLKSDIIIINKYYNNKKNKEREDLRQIEKLMEKF